MDQSGALLKRQNGMLGRILNTPSLDDELNDVFNGEDNAVIELPH
jgi:hypothetical protein